MKCRGISLADGMFAIMLLAFDFAAFRHLAWPVLDFTPLHLTLSLLPMLNVLAILGYRFLGNPSARHPWAIGFFGFGLGAMLAHVACVWLDVEVRWTYILPVGRFIRLCKAYGVPWVGRSPEGYSYFRYYPAVVLINFCVPQFLAAGLGGLICALAARSARGRIAARGRA